MAKSNKIIICAALTGTATPKEKNSNLPTTPDEIAADVVACGKAGASVVHIHARDKDGKGTMDPDVFQEIFDKSTAALRENGIDMVINLTTSGGRTKTIEEKVEHIRRIRPEIMSYDIGSFNWDDRWVYNNSPDFLRLAGKVGIECGTKPEIEVFDTGHIRSSYTYLKEGLLQAPLHFDFVLGVGGAMDGTVRNLNYLVEMLPEGSTWGVTGVGKCHLPMMYAALALDCDMLRVGLEDNLYLSRGVKATNVQLVERAVEVAKLYGREIATPQEARELMGITRRSWEF